MQNIWLLIICLQIVEIVAAHRPRNFQEYLWYSTFTTALMLIQKLPISFSSQKAKMIMHTFQTPTELWDACPIKVCIFCSASKFWFFIIGFHSVLDPPGSPLTISVARRRLQSGVCRATDMQSESSILLRGRVAHVGRSVSPHSPADPHVSHA